MWHKARTHALLEELEHFTYEIIYLAMPSIQNTADMAKAF